MKNDLNFLAKKYGAHVDADWFRGYEERSKFDPKQWPPLEPRIYPGRYAPVISTTKRGYEINFMRYGAYPPEGSRHRKEYTSYNARRDNLLSPFWANSFMRKHGFIVLEGFYEWVAVKDLIADKVIHLEDVEHSFAQQSLRRRAQREALGKPYIPTPIERKKPIERNIVIYFYPRDSDIFSVPVIISETYSKNHLVHAGFAIVTDEPFVEVKKAGHDRSPIVLQRNELEQWVEVANQKPETIQKWLQKKRPISFAYALDHAS